MLVDASVVDFWHTKALSPVWQMYMESNVTRRWTLRSFLSCDWFSCSAKIFFLEEEGHIY
jgi:hypothetical protein